MWRPLLLWSLIGSAISLVSMSIGGWYGQPMIEAPGRPHWLEPPPPNWPAFPSSPTTLPGGTPKPGKYAAAYTSESSLQSWTRTEVTNVHDDGSRRVFVVGRLETGWPWRTAATHRLVTLDFGPSSAADFRGSTAVDLGLVRGGWEYGLRRTEQFLGPTLPLDIYPIRFIASVAFWGLAAALAWRSTRWIHRISRARQSPTANREPTTIASPLTNTTPA